MNPAIRISHLSKQYRIGSSQEASYRTLRETIMDSAARGWRRARALVSGNAAIRPAASSFWALDDVSLDVQPGEVIGVIGRNGAGKSTLLRILSRITEPTSGRVELRGRVASLLEIGTGFHFELTGRENIFLNGAILGMKRREIARRFDEIVAFADIGGFLDTPVKRYSSGMHVRLAFAVACHLEPEILLVDEVLAVGDHAFQRKCLGKLDQVSRSGRTVLFVSHNMPAVANLCQRVAVLERGRLTYLGECRRGVAHYLDGQREAGAGEVDLSQHANRRPGCQPILQRLRLIDANGQTSGGLRCGDPCAIELLVRSDRPVNNLHFRIGVEDASRTRLFTVATDLSDTGPVPIDGLRRLTCSLDSLPLAPGQYSASVDVSALRGHPIDAVDHAVWFDVIAADFYGNGKMPDSDWGQFVARSRWEVADAEEEAGIPSASMGAMT